jgi:hypothetical protein
MDDRRMKCGRMEMRETDGGVRCEEFGESSLMMCRRLLTIYYTLDFDVDY